MDLRNIRKKIRSVYSDYVRQLALILFSSYELEFNYKEGKKRIIIAELLNIIYGGALASQATRATA